MATNLTLKQIQDILAAGAGGYTGQDGSIYNFSNNSMTDYTGGIDAPTIAGPNYFHASHDGVYDSFDNEGKYVGTDKQGNAANDMGKFLLAAGALAGGASAFGGAAGGGAAAGGVGAGQFGGLAALDTAAAASAAGGLSAADAALIASLGDGTFAAGAGGIGGAGAAAGGGAAAFGGGGGGAGGGGFGRSEEHTSELQSL